MIGVGETGVSIIAVAATLPLSIGLIGLTLVGKKQVKVHALGLAATGPLLLLLTTPLWGEGRVVLTGLLLSVFLLLTAAVSGHAIASLMHSQKEWEDAEESPGERDEVPPE